MRTLITSPERVRRTFNRMAYEVVERNQGAEGLVVFGILKSGLPVARALAERISPLARRAVRVYPLDVGPYRDDRIGPVPPSRKEQVQVSGLRVLLVDDVLQSGRTARAALDAIVRYGRPARIQLAVLVDRGYREVPIQPDYIGRTLQTKAQERVVVDVQGTFAVYVEE